MQTIKIVLDILRKYSIRKDEYKVEKLYRYLLNPEFYKLAYNNIYSKPGNMTKASDDSTIDGMSIDRINKIIESLKDGSYKPTILRRIQIPKKNSTKTRPISVPSFNDKLIQEVIRILLNELYEGSFSDHSHGFRPNRSCHSALHEIELNFQGTVWWIDADIKGCFDNIHHETLLRILQDKIYDDRFIHLINLFLKAGYLENHIYHKTYSGTPQGSIISPILCNIYLDKLDKTVEYIMKQYNCGIKRKANPKYNKVYNDLIKYIKNNKLTKNGDKLNNPELYFKTIHNFKIKFRNLSSLDPFDSKFKRISYVRYADDFLISVIGPKTDVLHIKEYVKDYLKTIKLELSEEKTKILHKDDKVRFLGYDVSIIQKCSVRQNNGHVNLSVPYEVMVNFIINHKTGKWWNSPLSGKDELKAIHRTELVNLDVLEIARQYDYQIRGLYEYYKLASNVYKLNGFNFIHITSYLRTIACKFKTSVAKLYKDKKYHQGRIFGTQYKNKKGEEKFLAIFDGPFEKQHYEYRSNVDNIMEYYIGRTSLISRMEANKCEFCNTEVGPFEVHHIKHMKDIKDGKANWEKLMISRQRKTLVLCVKCHDKLHSGDL